VKPARITHTIAEANVQKAHVFMSTKDTIVFVEPKHQMLLKVYKPGVPVQQLWVLFEYCQRFRVSFLQLGFCHCANPIKELLFVNVHFFKEVPEEFVVLNSAPDSKSTPHLCDKLIPPRDLSTESCAGNSQCVN
jgi:hypothetical protein